MCNLCYFPVSVLPLLTSLTLSCPTARTAPIHHQALQDMVTLAACWWAACCQHRCCLQSYVGSAKASLPPSDLEPLTPIHLPCHPMLHISKAYLSSSEHGKERRAERGICKEDVQAAVRYGRKEPGYSCPLTGRPRWKYTFVNIVCITDETSTKEVTSYLLSAESTSKWRQDAHRAHQSRRLQADYKFPTAATLGAVSDVHKSLEYPFAFNNAKWEFHQSPSGAAAGHCSVCCLEATAIDISTAAMTVTWTNVPFASYSAVGVAVAEDVLEQDSDCLTCKMTEINHLNQAVGKPMLATMNMQDDIGWCDTMARVQLIAGHVAVKFNQQLDKLALDRSLPRLQFRPPCMYQVTETLVDSQGVSFHHLELLVEASDCAAVEVDKCVAEAFAHFAYCYTQRQLIVCKLHGLLTMHDERAVYQCCHPVIHTVASCYGFKHDQGESGIAAFFRTHKCGALCKELDIVAK